MTLHGLMALEFLLLCNPDSENQLNPHPSQPKPTQLSLYFLSELGFSLEGGTSLPKASRYRDCSI